MLHLARKQSESIMNIVEVPEVKALNRFKLLIEILTETKPRLI
jgi:hypothetical protein